jgi:hypothetical protein
MIDNLEAEVQYTVKPESRISDIDDRSDVFYIEYRYNGLSSPRITKNRIIVPDNFNELSSLKFHDHRTQNT